jgi:hypothetical protein
MSVSSKEIGVTSRADCEFGLRFDAAVEYKRLASS